MTETAQTTTSTPPSLTTSPPPTTGSIPSTNGSSTAVLPASFVVNADGSLSPPLIAGPADTAIRLTITSHAPHPVTVHVASTTLGVPPGTSATARLLGLKPGRYPITVDGARRAVFVAGAQPGP